MHWDNESDERHQGSIELFRDGKVGFERTFSVKVSMRNVMPLAISLSDGVWAVALEKELDISR